MRFPWLQRTLLTRADDAVRLAGRDASLSSSKLTSNRSAVVFEGLRRRSKGRGRQFQHGAEDRVAHRPGDRL